MQLFAALQSVLDTYLPEEQIAEIKQAYFFARDAHAGQTRFSGEPYITHPIAVAIILAKMHLDRETLIAALLHDIIEDTPITFLDIKKYFSTNIAILVEGVSKLDKLNFQNQKEAEAENFRKMIMAMVQDIRVVLIKLADRTHNMRTIWSLSTKKRRRIAKETLEIYSPLAHRLGIHNLKIELEELGFQALYPNRYRVIKQVVKIARGNRKQMINTILAEIREKFSAAKISSYVIGREKHLYSIYCKMRKKENKFHSIMDIYAFRVITQQVEDCYRVLGHVHSLYKPRPGRVKDYIAIAKNNGYQSLHTSLIGPDGVPVEIQIRTEEMDQLAEMGIAAHWLYKNKQAYVGTHQIRTKKWVESLMELQQNAGSSVEFIEHVKMDLLPGEIYIFTPKGSIIELPHGATAVDFAYEVHTDIGNGCIGARIDRYPYPLSKPLQNGQTVKIIVSPDARPNAAWLNFVVTSKARTKIRHFLKRFKFNESICLGRRLLNHALTHVKLEEIPQALLQKELAHLKYSSLNELLASIGIGNIMSVVVAKNLEEEFNTSPQVNKKKRKLLIKSADGLLISFAKCCRPIPGDLIIAHVSPGKGLVIHCESCRNVQNYGKEPEKYMAVELSNDIDHAYITEILVTVQHQPGALARLTSAIHAADSNIHHLNTEDRGDRTHIITIQLTARDRSHLAQIIRKIKNQANVFSIKRKNS